LIVNSYGIEVEYFDFAAPRGNMEYSLLAVPRRYRTLPAFHKVKMLDHGWSVHEKKEGVLDIFKREWERDYEEW
jgi:hypothetical protein